MIHPTHRREALHAAVPVAVSFVLVVMLWISPAPEGIKGLANYLPLHTALEMAAIFFAGMIFAITWHTPRSQISWRNVLVGSTFAGVALLDVSHALSYSGMPSFVTPSSPAKAIYFWLAARCMAAVGLLIHVRMQDDTTSPTHRQSLMALSIVLTVVAVVHVLVLFDADSLPRVFIDGQGLTPWKIHAEYALVIAYLVPALILAPKLREPRTHHVSGFMAAAVLMAMSEFMLTLYADVTDLYNLAGHILKIAAYFYLYQPLFVESLQLPYERLQEALGELKATMQALPDLLFELDEDGRFLAVHTGRSDLLALPPDAFLGKTMREVLPSATADVGLEAIAEAKEKGVSHGKLYTLNIQDASFFFELSVAPKPHSPHEKARYIFIARDVTQRVESEKRLKKEALFNAALIDLPQEEASVTVPARLHKALESIVTLTDSGIGFIGLLAHDGSSLLPVALSHPPSNVSAENTAYWQLHENDIWSKAIRERRPVIFNQPQEIPALAHLPPELGQVHRWLALPIFEGKTLVMVAGIGNKATPYVESDVEFLHLMCYSVWQITHKHETDRELRRFSLATSQSPNPVLITDLDARIEYVNEAFSAVTGYSPSDVMGKNPRILQSGKTPKAIYRDMWDKLASGRAWTGELINRRKNGQEYYEKALIYPIRNEAGVITHYLAHKEDVSDKKSAAERIQYLSEFDQLTGLPNRTLLMEQLQFGLSQARRAVQPMTLLWLNLDLFKDINDTYGHATGDRVLRELAQRLREVTQGQDILARYSGDNFILVRTNIDQLGSIRLVDQVLEALARPITVQGEDLVLTASIGLALYPNDGTSATDLMRCAETAMYRVKHDRRNSYSFYAPDMQERSARALQLTNALKLAFSRQELRLVYQPQVSLLDGQVTGAEALIRWRHPQLGDIPPAEFIPLAENAGLGAQVGEWVLQSVLADMKQWLQSGEPVVKVAINLSAAQFSEPQLVEKIRAQLEQSGVSPQWLELELTEIAAMKNPTVATQTMAQLSELGLSLSIDDFGTGYSSLSHLKRFDIYKLKIDQSFVRDVVDDPEDQAIVTAIVNMAHSLGMTTLAEGVETLEQLSFLKKQHCDEIQGYLYSYPLEREAFTELLRSPPRLQLPV